MKVHRLLLLLTLVMGLGACAYFNALYNARQLYDDARRATERGDASVAEQEHRESLEKAARAFRSDPSGRWADDALLLVARNQFALGNCPAARAALGRLETLSSERELLEQAGAYLGAVHVCLEQPDSALPHLDRAVESLEPATAMHAFARLWRGRALFAMDSVGTAWTDLERAATRTDAVGREATLEQVTMALRHDEPAIATAAMRRLLTDPQGDLFTDSLIVLSRAASEQWGGGVVRGALAGAATAPWPGEERDRLLIERAAQAAAAGDTATAIAELNMLASQAMLSAASAARMEMARLQLANARSASDLEVVRATLLPALSHPQARPLVQAIAMTEALLGQARQHQPLGFFAAAEVARDELGAHALARQLFLTYADMAGETPWATKALLAALALAPSGAEADALRRRVATMEDPYAAAARGGAALAMENAERRLDVSLRAIRTLADAEVRDQEVAVGGAIAELDSLAAAARADSVRVACGTMIDSVGVVGIRADSVRAACVRGDVALVDSFLVADTTLFVDSVAVTEQEAESDGAPPEMQQ